jgi:predicted transcriptional regulator
MPTIEVSDRTKQMIDRLVAEGRAADTVTCVDAAIHLFAEETEAYQDDTASVTEQAKRGIADIEAGRFTAISSAADEEAFWERVRTRSAHMVKDLRAAQKEVGRTIQRAAVAD